MHRGPALRGRRRAPTSNLDVLAGEGLDLVICLNPTSSLHASSPRRLGERVAFAIRQRSGRRLGVEAARVSEAGSEVALIQPTVHDLDVMGTNLMSRSRRTAVTKTAVQTVTEHLRASAVGGRLKRLPPGLPELVTRPSGPPASWPDLHAAVRRRWRAQAALERDAGRRARRRAA